MGRTLDRVPLKTTVRHSSTLGETFEIHVRLSLKRLIDSAKIRTTTHHTTTNERTNERTTGFLNDDDGVLLPG
jgi:hypothetical protein